MKMPLISLLVIIVFPINILFCQDTIAQSSQGLIDTTYHFKNEKIANWLDQFDLDGDRKNDRIYFEFSGGGHCCYKIHIVLSSDKVDRKYPFKMDGGYIGGVDNTQPDQFDIRDVDNDGLPEILMEIQTYNGDAYPIPKEWQSKYGIKTNRIVIEYDKGKSRLKVRDYL